MSFLAPLYIAGALAVGLPILFHLIRRAPRGKQNFSSLMFLTASPPRLTRRSRLTHILLLILRAAALILLAFAFARPLFRRHAEADAAAGAGKRIAILLDTSASMRRADLWDQAKRQAEDVLDRAAPGDQIGLYFFDREVRPALTFAEWNELEATHRAAVLRSRLAEASPTWSPTKLGDALAAAADLLGETQSGAGASAGPRQLILISDLQQGARAESLQGHQWPDNVSLEVRAVTPKQPTNASLQLVEGAGAAAAAEKDDGKLRVRVTNQGGSQSEQFTLAWADARGPVAGAEPLKVYVPPGRSQVLRVPWPAQGQVADRLVLQGDDHPFDNTLYVVPPRKEPVRVGYIGDDTADDTKGLRYYLRTAAGDTERRQVEHVARPSAQPLAIEDVAGARLIVVGGALPEDRASVLRRFAESGGDVLFVLKDTAGAKPAARLLNVEALVAEESTANDYALISRVETDHPLFAPFADARFGDFTKIHFWKHRKLKAPAGTRVLAWFDNGNPFLIEQVVGKGRILLATSGWHPADSQLALSTKFVPLLDGLLRRRDDAAGTAQFTVFETIALPPSQPGETTRALIKPDARRIDLPATATTSDAADQPGIYKLSTAGREVQLAVNLPPDESRTAPISVEDLERWGAHLAVKKSTDAEFAAQQRQLHTMELENKQKMWRWLILGVLGLLAAETALASRQARQTSQPQVSE
jgi:hypothetical protein